LSGLTRRGALGALAAAAAAPAVGRAGEALALKAAARRAGLLYGAAVEPESLDRDPAFARLTAGQCAVLVPENVMKWNALRPEPGVYDFGRADRLTAIAGEMGCAVHGHCLAWHEADPTWLDAVLAAGEGAQALSSHIRTVVARYAGRVRSWDVVNEAVERNDHRPDGLRVSPWLRALGPDYVALAFQTAHAADPAARLALADYGLEYDDERWMLEKRDTMLRLLERLRSGGVPVHALAVQGHLDGARAPAFGGGLRGFLADVAALGLDIYVTELDVNDQHLAADPPRRDAAVAACYRAFLEVVCDEPAVRMINTWGLSDRYTSKRTMFPRPDGAPVRPLPFDEALAPKLAALAMAEVFRARAGRRGGG
jgi:endo-1,4-beta-xylanase